jgi:hypothetical protein
MGQEDSVVTSLDMVDGFIGALRGERNGEEDGILHEGGGVYVEGGTCLAGQVSDQFWVEDWWRF